jgi:PAS domain-containing protein
MHKIDKTKDELLLELKELKQKNLALKVMLEKDITGRKNAEESMRISEERFSMLINSTSDMVFLKDDQFKHIIANIP